MSSNLCVFISHRTPDRLIADEIRNALELWGIPESSLFQSTHPTSGLNSGDGVKEGLMEKLKNTDLFILIYTSPDQDWSYCMWELGAAIASDTKQTQVVCFSCTGDDPKLMTDVLINHISHDDIKKFTYNIHKTDDFLIKDSDTQESEISLLINLRGASDLVIETRSTQLYEALKTSVPAGEKKDLHRWDYLQFYLEPSVLNSIKELEGQENTKNTQYELIKKHTILLRPSQNSAVRAFGYQDFETGITIEKLRNRWVSEYVVKNSIDKDEFESIDTNWELDLCGDIIRAIFNKRAQRTFSYFESISIDQPTFYRPAVIKAKRLIDDSMKFDVYLYRLAAEEMELVKVLIKSQKTPG